MASSPGIGAGAQVQSGGPAPTRSGSGSGIGAAGDVTGGTSDTRPFPSDAGWNALQLAWFHDSPVALWQAKRTRAAIRKLASRAA